jgi:hypothetical protein
MNGHVSEWSCLVLTIIKLLVNFCTFVNFYNFRKNSHVSSWAPRVTVAPPVELRQAAESWRNDCLKSLEPKMSRLGLLDND